MTAAHNPNFHITRDNNHIYKVDGAVYPSVTQIIGEHLGVEYYHLTDFYKERGSEVDRCAIMALEGKLDFESVDSRVLPYITVFLRWATSYKFKPLICHGMVFHPTLLYAGEFDLFGTINDDPMPYLIDIKTGSKMSHYKLQTAKYAMAIPLTYPCFSYLAGLNINRAGLYLSEKGYKFDPHDNPADLAFAQAIAISHRAKELYA